MSFNQPIIISLHDYFRGIISALISILFLVNMLPNIMIGQVNGMVIDELGNPLEFANVLLLTASDSSFLKGEIVDIDGKYQFNYIDNGIYICKFSMVGYSDVFSDEFELNAEIKTIDLGKAILDESIRLSTVEIVAKRAFLEQKIDRTVVNVSNSITNAGGNALEVLQRSPGVLINRLSKTISLAGKEGIILMINGKISRLPAEGVVQLLEGMNADNIDKIELIHTPPANFDAEGNAGIINIVLKSTGDQGLNGNYAINMGRGRGDKYGGSINFNLRKNIFNLYGGYDRNYNLNPQVFTNYRGINQGSDFVETYTISRRPKTPTTVQNARLGVDIDLSKKTVLGVLTTLFDRNWYMEAVNEATFSKNGTVVSRLLMPNSEINRSKSFSGNLNLVHKFSEDKTLTLDADIVKFDINNPSNYNISIADGTGIFKPEYRLELTKETPIDVYVLKADYFFKLNNVSLETGLKYTALKFDNDIKVDSIRPDKMAFTLQEYTSLAHMDENIKAAYCSFSVSLSKNTDLKGGLRYEYTNTNLSTAQIPNLVDRHYGSWFPSLYLTQKITDNQTLNISYSRRIFRPQISQLAPFLVFSDPTTLLGGNPAIQPSFTDAYKLDYNFNSYRTGISYTSENFPISFIPIVDAVTNKQTNTFKNLDNRSGVNSYLYLPLHPTTWWDMTNNIYTNWTNIKFNLEGKDIEINYFNFGMSSNNTFTLPKSFTAELSCGYDGPSYFGVAKWNATGYVNLGIQKDFGQTWGKLRFNVSDIFLNSNWFGITNQPQSNLLVDVSFQFAERVFMLSWSNNFGSTKLKSKRDRQTGASEVMQRM